MLKHWLQEPFYFEPALLRIQQPNLTFTSMRVLFLLLSGVSICSGLRRPGARVGVNTTAIDYLADVGLLTIESNLRKLQVPDVASDPGFSNYAVHNISIDALRVNEEKLSILPIPENNGFKIQLNDAYIHLHGNYHLNIGPLWKEDGRIDFGMSGISLGMFLSLGMVNGEDGRGRLSMNISQCEASASGVDISFTGGSFDNFLNLFKALIDLSLKPKIGNMMCDNIDKDVNEFTNKQLLKIPMVLPISETGVEVDLSLTGSPSVQMSDISIELDGESYLKGLPKPEYNPHPLPALPFTHRMFHTLADQDLVNSFAQAFFDSGLMNLNVTKAMVKKSSPQNAHYLNISCTDYNCIGSMLPTVDAKFGGGDLWVGLSVLSAPEVTLTHDSTVTVSLDVNLDFRAQFKNGTIEPIFNTDLLIGLIFTNVSLTTHEDFYTLSIQSTDCTTPNATLISSNCDGVTQDVVQMLFQFSVTFAITTQMAEALAAGVKLPYSGPIQIWDTDITIFDHAVLLDFDARFKF